MTKPTQPAPVPVGGTAFYWLVELRPAFVGHPAFPPTYYAGWMKDPLEAARTQDAYATPRFTRKEDAERVAKELGHTLSCVWAAVEHGFHDATLPLQSQPVAWRLPHVEGDWLYYESLKDLPPQALKIAEPLYTKG